MTIQSEGKRGALVNWADRGVPQMAHYAANPPQQTLVFPALPEQLHAVEPGLCKALADAAQIADLNTTRYALNNLAE